MLRYSDKRQDRYEYVLRFAIHLHRRDRITIKTSYRIQAKIHNTYKGQETRYTDKRQDTLYLQTTETRNKIKDNYKFKRQDIKCTPA